MRRLYVIAAVGTMAMMAGGCAGTGSQVTFPSQIEVSQGTEHTVTVESTETVMAVPDVAEIMFTVRTKETEAEACQQKNQETLSSVLEYLKGQGLEDGSIQTSGYYLSPMYNWTEEEGQVLTGYEMSTQITVSDIPIEQAGEILSGAVDAGANYIDFVHYLCSSYDQYYQEALMKAVETAKVKAEALGEAGGFQVLDVAEMEEYGEDQSARYLANYAAAGRATSSSFAEESSYDAMNVSAGELEIQANLRVTFQIK